MTEDTRVLQLMDKQNTLLVQQNALLSDLSRTLNDMLWLQYMELSGARPDGEIRETVVYGESVERFRVTGTTGVDWTALNEDTDNHND